MRRATGLSSLASCFSAVWETPICQTKPRLYVVQCRRAFLSVFDAPRDLLCQIRVFKGVKMMQDGFAGVKGLAAAGALGKSIEPGFDFFRQADGQHGRLLHGAGWSACRSDCYKSIAIPH